MNSYLDEEMILLEFHETWEQFVNTSLYLHKSELLATNATAIFVLEDEHDPISVDLNEAWANRDPRWDEDDYFHVVTLGHIYDGRGKYGCCPIYVTV